MTARRCALKELQTSGTPASPIPQHQDALPRISADAAQAGDEATERAKQFATLRARAARAGVELRAVQDDAGALRYLGVKWAETASFADLAALGAWLDRIDGRGTP